MSSISEHLKVEWKRKLSGDIQVLETTNKMLCHGNEANVRIGYEMRK